VGASEFSASEEELARAAPDGCIRRAAGALANEAMCAAKERLGEHCFSADADEAWDGALGAIGRG